MTNKIISQKNNISTTIPLLIPFYSPAWDLGTIWAPFTEKAPLTQAIKETPRTRKNIEFMRVSGVF